MAACVVLLGLLTGVGAAAEPEVTPAKTGEVAIDGPPVNPQLYAQVLKRLNAGVNFVAVKMPNDGMDGKHPENSDIPTKFNAFVPDGYKPDGSWGLMVFISPTDSGTCPGDMEEVCAKHQLLLITPQDTSNELHQPWRVSLALKAVQEMRSRYKFNPERTYLVGSSGGGRAASQAVILFPDVFEGAICNCGVDFVQVNGEPRQSIDIFDALPEVVRRSAAQDRLYLYTGSKDDNHDETRDVYNWLKKIGFRYVQFYSQDGAGHAEMNKENFEKGVDFLDAPLDAEAAVKMKQADTLAQRGSFGRAIVMYQKAAATAPGTDSGTKARQQADQLIADYQSALSDVKATLANGDKHKTAAAINELARKYAPYSNSDVDALRKALEEKPQIKPANPASPSN
jgi:hypothetical protein